MVILKDGLIMTKNNKWLIHFYMYTRMVTELCFFVCIALEYFAGVNTVFNHVNSMSILVLIATVSCYKPLLHFFHFLQL